jgi:YD repeat-containing protein
VTTISLGADGTPHNNKNGFAYLKVRRDAKGRELKVIRLDINICPIPDSNGDYGLLREYDDINNEITTISLGTDGKPHNNLSKFAYKIETKDYLQRTIRELIFDADHNPAYDSDGNSGTLYVYNDEENEVTIISLGVNGEPHNNNQGYAYKELYKDVLGRTIKELIFDVDHNPAFDNVGDSGTAWEYNDEENEVTTISLGADGTPHNNNNGFTYQRVKRDAKGRELKVVRLDKDGNLVCDGNGDYGVLREYDDQNNIITTILLGADGKMHNNNGIAYKVETLDKQGRTIKEFFYDIDRNPAFDNVGDSGTAWEYNDEENEVTTISLGVNGEPHNNNQGYAYKEIYKDSQNRTIKELIFDANHNPAFDSMSDSGKLHLYYDEENKETTISLGVDGKPHNNNQGYAFKICTITNDVKIYKYLDINKKPIPQVIRDLGDGQAEVENLNIDGSSRKGANGVVYRRIYMDELGRPVKQLYFDVNHTPATNDIGDYGVVYEYIDNDSRCYYITSLDINENPRINSNGFSKRYVLEDVEERVIKELTYGLTDEPVCDEDGCYGYEYRYTSNQNEKITISLGANGSQIETRSGWAYKKEVIDTSDRVIEVYYYDAQNQPTDNFGFKIHYFDDENGTRLITRIGRDGNPSEGRNGICRIVELIDNNGNETTLYYDLKGNRVEKKWWRNILKFLKIE